MLHIVIQQLQPLLGVNVMHLNQRYFNHAGFTLIELMIAMVIGLIATIVITQTMANFEGDKLATTGSSDSQTNANIGLFSIAREVKQAGFGLMGVGVNGTDDSALDCSTVNLNASLVTSLSSVQITNGTSDTITIRYGSSDFGGAVSTLTENNDGSSVDVKSSLACAVGDVAIVISGNTCNLTTVTAVENAPTKAITFANAVGSSGDDFACIGEWNEVTYRVDANDNLERDTDKNLTNPGQPIVADIVNLQAQYGVSLSVESNQISQWVDAVNIAGGEDWSAPTLSQRKRIKAIRVAIIARNPYIEPEAVTNACDQDNNSGLCAWADVPQAGPITIASPAPDVDLTADPGWQRYHYSVYESIIPIRNTIWSKGTL